jgi:xanthine dehydrogenase YagT iron-sulfur-binding subunit
MGETSKIGGRAFGGLSTKEAMVKKDDEKKKGLTRRGFFQLMGAGALASASIRGVSAEGAAEVMEPAEMIKVRLLINGRRHRLLVEPRWSLLFVLRERLGLTGTKVGCERGECGACTVPINGQPRYACMTLAVEAEGK